MNNIHFIVDIIHLLLLNRCYGVCVQTCSLCHMWCIVEMPLRFVVYFYLYIFFPALNDTAPPPTPLSKSSRISVLFMAAVWDVH